VEQDEIKRIVELVHPDVQVYELGEAYNQLFELQGKEIMELRAMSRQDLE